MLTLFHLASLILSMSKENRTLSDLQDNIDEDYTWRIKELDDFKGALTQAKPEVQKSLIRSGITLLYAHWEGFIKNVAGHYYNYVSLKKLYHRELKENYVALCLRKALNELLDSKKIVLQTKSVEFLLSEIDKRAQFPSDLPLKTSNLTYDVFEDYCLILGLDISHFELKKQFIDKKLVENRNTIAHGKYLLVDMDTFIDIYDITLELLRTVKDNVENSAVLENYKRK